MRAMEIELLPPEAKSELFEFYQYLLYKYDSGKKVSDKGYDATSDPIYRLGQGGETVETKENFSENIDRYLYGEGDCPK